jgi:hypothetical protein
MKKDILTFNDFLSDKPTINSHIDDLQDITENIEEILEEETTEEEFNLSIDKLNLLKEEFELTDDEINKISSNTKKSEDDDFYKLWRDINEKFECDIFIEGARHEETEVRLVIESEDWNLIFRGYIQDGKCHIPIKKLEILEENLIGDIKLEVIAEGSVFIPWSGKFVVKSSKNIKTLNEGLRPKIGVEVGKVK